MDAAIDAAIDAEVDAAPPIVFGFTDVTEELGLGGYRHWNESYPVPCYLSESRDCGAMELTGGIAVRDVDGDGRADIYLARMEAADVLLRNTPEGFVDVTAAMGLPDEPRFSNSAAFADIDNDGDADLYVGGITELDARLFIMEDGIFVESAADWRATLEDGEEHTQMSACFGDIDNDGLLDLHTTEWSHIADGRADHGRLLDNTGTTFRDATDRVGVSMRNTGRLGIWSFTSHIVDLDRDGWSDLIVAADFGSSRLFWNEEAVSFSDGTDTAAVGSDENGMGSALGDVDGDGDLDWFVSAIYYPEDVEGCEWGRSGNRLFRHEDDRTFVDVTDDAGVRDGGWGWGARFFDYDLDGDLDLILTNGARSFCADLRAYLDDPIRLWENDGTGHFEEVAALRGVDGRGQGRGLITFDYDLDGDEDVLVMNNLEGPRLWRNDYADGKSWIVVKPVGTLSNRDGFGAVVRVWPTADSEPIVRHAGNGCGFLGHSPGTPRVGLGDLDVAYAVEVTWPASNNRQRFYDVPARQVFEVVEPDTIRER